MSWGNSASGNASQVKSTCAGWAPTVLANDQKYAAGPNTLAVHQAQAKSAEQAIGAIVDAYPEGSVFTVSVSGTCSEASGTGSLHLGFNVSVPMQSSVPTNSEGAES